MTPKYESGSRVRIRIAEWSRGPYSDLWKYENETGEIVGSSQVVAFYVRPWAIDVNDIAHVLQVYRVHLDTGFEIDQVIEDCLERFNGS